MPPEETLAPEVSQPVPESPSTAAEALAPAAEPATPPTEASPATVAPESSSAPTETVPVTETVQSPTSTAQIPPNEPIVSESEPIETTPEPPSAAASAPAPVIAQTGILHAARELLAKARVSIQDRKRKKRDKIMETFTKKNKITNDEVEKLLHVSDATATRYLSALEKEGKIRQVGKTGTGVAYTRA